MFHPSSTDSLHIFLVFFLRIGKEFTKTPNQDEYRNSEIQNSQKGLSSLGIMFLKTSTAAVPKIAAIDVPITMEKPANDKKNKDIFIFFSRRSPIDNR